MTVEEFKDLMICLIEEGKEDSVVAIRKGNVIVEISLDSLRLISPASDFLTEKDIDRFSE